jgi:cobaltochelatase CobN
VQATTKEVDDWIFDEIEGWMVDRMGDVKGEFQGGAINVVTSDEVAAWKEKMSKVLGA